MRKQLGTFYCQVWKCANRHKCALCGGNWSPEIEVVGDTIICADCEIDNSISKQITELKEHIEKLEEKDGD